MPDGRAWPRISIVTPSFNQGQFIEETIRSVLLQSYPNLEYIIIDGGSTDNTVEIIKKYERHINYWVSEKDRGQSHAINKGMARATGDVCGWLCSDDLLTNGALGLIGAQFAKGSGCRWLTGAAEAFYPEEGRRRLLQGGLDAFDSLLDFSQYGSSGHFVPQPSTFWEKTLWDDVGGLEETLHLAMDYELWLRFQEKTVVVPIDSVLSVVRLYPNCKSSARRADQVREMMRAAYCAAERTGSRPLSVTLRMWRHVTAKRIRQIRTDIRIRRWRRIAIQLLGLVRDLFRVWSENGRIRMIVR
jgi:glycosyltransferase involved in cell wall biosynthesis